MAHYACHTGTVAQEASLGGYCSLISSHSEWLPLEREWLTFQTVQQIKNISTKGNYYHFNKLTSLCLDEGVLELEEMLEWGLCDGNSFLTDFASPLPFSLGEEVPLVAEFELPFPASSLATSTTSSWSLFSPSLSCKIGMMSPLKCCEFAGVHGGKHTFSSFAFRFFSSCSFDGDGGLRARNFSRSFGEIELRCVQIEKS